MTTIKEIIREAASAVCLSAGFELIAIAMFGLFLVFGARWVAS